MFVILNSSLCHSSERSEESPLFAQDKLRKESSFFAQGRLREESHGSSELKIEILRLPPQNNIMTRSLGTRGGRLRGTRRRKRSPQRRVWLNRLIARGNLVTTT